MKKSDFEYVLSLLRQYAGWDLSNDKYFIIDKKLYNFICEKGYASVEDLIAELKIGQKAMLWQVVEALTLSDTYFYRDYPVFKAFENYLLPQLREINRSSKKLRIWSLGCSTGQEAYSIAMAVKHKLLGIKDWNVNIIGTDISSYSIGKAQKGLFSQFDVQMGLNMRQILENFHQDQGQWQLNDDILSMVEFSAAMFCSIFRPKFSEKSLRRYTAVKIRPASFISECMKISGDWMSFTSPSAEWTVSIRQK